MVWIMTNLKVPEKMIIVYQGITFDNNNYDIRHPMMKAQKAEDFPIIFHKKAQRTVKSGHDECIRFIDMIGKEGEFYP